MTTALPDPKRAAARSAAHRLAALLLGMGTLHFLAPKPFDGIVPTELPGSPRAYTYVSGVAELAAGGLLTVPRTRRLGALAALAVFLGVFPGNLNMVRVMWDRPWPVRAGLLARLPLQIPLITEALKVRRHG